MLLVIHLNRCFEHPNLNLYEKWRRKTVLVGQKNASSRLHSRRKTPSQKNRFFGRLETQKCEKRLECAFIVSTPLRNDFVQRSFPQKTIKIFCFLYRPQSMFWAPLTFERFLSWESRGFWKRPRLTFSSRLPFLEKKIAMFKSKWWDFCFSCAVQFMLPVIDLNLHFRCFNLNLSRSDTEKSCHL